MIELLLAEALSPAVHPGQIRFPARRNSFDVNGINIENDEKDGDDDQQNKELREKESTNRKIRYKGDAVYPMKKLREIERECGIEETDIDSYARCAVLMSAIYAKEGFINTKAYAAKDSSGPYILIIAGRIVEIRVEGGNSNIDSLVERFIKRLKGRVLNVNDLNRYLKAIKARIPDIASINARLSRLGSDNSKTRLVLEVGLIPTKLGGTIEVGNDGSLNGGEIDAQILVYKNSSFKAGDSMVFYSEEFLDRSLEIGQTVTTISYQYPVTSRVNILTGMSFTKNFEPDTAVSWDDFSSRQFQYTVGIDVGLSDNALYEAKAGASFVGQSGSLFYQGVELPDIVPDIIRQPKSGYLQLSVAQSRLLDEVFVSSKAYFIKALTEYTPYKQLEELSQLKIDINDANAIGGYMGIVHRPNQSLNNSLDLFGQYALSNLTQPMRFSLGSGIGLKGLPDQFVSGDSGWAVIGKSEIRVRKSSDADIYLKPYIGFGYIISRFNSSTLDDYVGSYGLTMELRTKPGISLEVGYLKNILMDQLKTRWKEWWLANGLYGRIKYRF